MGGIYLHIKWTATQTYPKHKVSTLTSTVFCPGCRHFEFCEIWWVAVTTQCSWSSSHALLQLPFFHTHSFPLLALLSLWHLAGPSKRWLSKKCLFCSVLSSIIPVDITDLNPRGGEKWVFIRVSEEDQVMTRWWCKGIHKAIQLGTGTRWKREARPPPLNRNVRIITVIQHSVEL